ncbi:MAG: DUF1990 family protein [Acidobacteria bacterium]|nr:DUF1990 family protein [Acidobacteriota bacterium]
MFPKTVKPNKFSYPHVGLLATTQDRPNLPFNNQIEAVVGTGSENYHLLARAMMAGQLFPQWARLPNPRIQPGAELIMDARIFGLSFHLPLRIIVLIESHEKNPCCGFIYGTLLGHYLSGEERFLLIWDPESNLIRYQIQSFAQLQKKWIWPFSPLIRHLQQKFLSESCTIARDLCLAQG